MLSSKNVFNDQITTEMPRYLSQADFEIENRRTNVAPNDVLLTIVGTVGRAAVVPEDFPQITFQRSVAVIKPRLNAVNPRFLMYALHRMSDDLAAGARGVAQKGVYLEALRELLVPLPSLDEQKRIVAILDEAFEGLNRARANAEANLQNARELFERYAATQFEAMDEAVPFDKLYVEDLALREKGSIRTGPFGSQLLHSEFVSNGIPVLGIDNAVSNEFKWGKKRFVTAEKYDQLRRYTVFPGDVVITIMGTCGRCAVIPENIPTAINTKHLCCITLDRNLCLPEYLHRYFLFSESAREYLASETLGSIMDGLNMGIIKRMPVKVPGIEKQHAIVAAIDEIQSATKRLYSSYEAALQDFADLRQSLMQKAFAGELN